MKRLILVLLAAVLLCGCSSGAAPKQTVTVSLLETPGCFIPANGQRIESGADAVFELVLEDGYAFSSVDYEGEYAFYVENGKEYLRLYRVRYPARLRLRLTDQFRTIYYDPNGGEGQVTRRDYDLRDHLRPNTAIGTDLFRREGYTLTGWNTEADGTGQPVGLGSRVSVPDSSLTLYAQWAPWSAERNFTYRAGDGVTVTGYSGADEILAIPEVLGGKTVTGVAKGAFSGCGAKRVILPATLRQVEDGAFADAALEELVLFDSISRISSGAFSGCGELRTLRINAQVPPCDQGYRKETCLADKVDLLIEARGQRKIVFYGGCSMWYNLDGEYMQQQIGAAYRVINAGLNGVVNSALQMQILTACLEEGDIFFHTPELSSKTQLMSVTTFGNQDDKLWCGLERNYDLLAAVDLRCFPDLLDSLNQWLNFKQASGRYEDRYEDTQGRVYLDAFGSIPFYRGQTEGPLADPVYLDPSYIEDPSMALLEQYYDAMAQKGVTVYVSYACVNMDAVPPDQRENIRLMDQRFRQCLDAMESAVLISSLEDYRYHNEDFFDTNYHLLSDPAGRNTGLWLRDLKRQMQADGLWEGETE